MSNVEVNHSVQKDGVSAGEKAERYPVRRKPQEYSFTLLEVIIATGLLVAVVLQVAGGQGSLLEITDYSKKATEATWLAKRIMSQVEANYANHELKDMDFQVKDAVFEDYKDPDADYKYNLVIEEWKLPLIDFLTGGGGKSEEEKEEDKDEGKPDSAMAGIPGLDAMINQVFGEHMMKTAHVEVSWPEGARRNSVSLVYLLTNQKALDQYVLTKANTWDQIRKKMDPNFVDKPVAGGSGGGGGGGNPNDPNNPNAGNPGDPNSGNPGNGIPGSPGGPGSPGSPGSPTGTGGIPPGSTPPVR